MKQVAIVGTGLGADTLTPEAREAISQAGVLLGAPRLLEQWGEPSKPSHPCYLPKDVAALIESEDAKSFAVLVSGDVGFYSAATGLQKALEGCAVRLIPGISTVSAFFARLQLPWQEAAFVSAHGRTMNLVDTVRRNRLTFCLTGNNVGEIGAALRQSGFSRIKTYVGENLGAGEERILEVAAGELEGGSFSPLTVLLFVNERFDDRTPWGLPDSAFSRLEGIPMTKSEARALILSRLNLRPTDLCWDVGAGTGSVAVEMALTAYRGFVYAVERREDAIPLMEKNRAAFQIGNLAAIRGEAPRALEALPAPNAVFIGGSGGTIAAIISAALGKNPRSRMVVSSVTLETTAAAMAALADAGLHPEIVQLSAARAKAAGSLHRLEAQNPITILSAGGTP